MYLNKTRWLIIAALLLLNILFAVILNKSNNEITKIPNEMINNAVKSLNASGVSVKKDIIPVNVPNNTIYSYQVIQAVNSENKKYYKYSDKLVAFFLKNKLKRDEKAKASFFDIPEGFSININAVKNNGNSREFAAITCSGDFGFEYQRSDFNTSILKLNKTDNKLLSLKNKKILNDFFSIFNENYKTYEYKATVVKQTKSGSLILCRQMLNGTSLANMKLYFYINNDDEILYISGKWCFENFEKKYSQSLIDGINILYSLAGKSGIRINSEKIVYMPVKYAAQKYYLIPSWSVIYTDKDRNTVNNIYEAIKGTEIKSTYIKTGAN